MSINRVFAVLNTRIQFSHVLLRIFAQKTLWDRVRENSDEVVYDETRQFLLVILIFNFLRSHPIEHKTYDMPADAMAHGGSPINAVCSSLVRTRSTFSN